MKKKYNIASPCRAIKEVWLTFSSFIIPLHSGYCLVICMLLSVVGHHVLWLFLLLLTRLYAYDQVWSFPCSHYLYIYVVKYKWFPMVLVGVQYKSVRTLSFIEHINRWTPTSSCVFLEPKCEIRMWGIVASVLHIHWVENYVNHLCEKVLGSLNGCKASVHQEE